jgi:hypothetical protein
MKIQSYLATVLFTLVSVLAEGQVTAGVAGLGFYHVTSVPSFLLEDTEYGFPFETAPKTKSIDLNGDGNFDIVFEVDYHKALGGGGGMDPFEYPKWSEMILANEGFEILQDTTAAYTGNTPLNSQVNVAAILDTLYNIEENPNDLFYSVNLNPLPIAWNINNAYNVPGWIGATNKYIGIKQPLLEDTLYGWVRISVPDWNQIIIHEYAFQSTITLDTLLDLSVSSNHFEESLNIWPNPFSERLYFQSNPSNRISEVDMYSIQGKMEMQISFPEEEITTSSLTSGVYIAVVRFENGMDVRRRVVKL